MKKPYYTLGYVLELLRREVEASGSQEAFAEKADVSQQYVGDILRGQRTPGKKILDAVGLEKHVVYIKKEE